MEAVYVGGALCAVTPLDDEAPTSAMARRREMPTLLRAAEVVQVPPGGNPQPLERQLIVHGIDGGGVAAVPSTQTVVVPGAQFPRIATGMQRAVQADTAADVDPSHAAIDRRSEETAWERRMQAAIVIEGGDQTAERYPVRVETNSAKSKQHQYRTSVNSFRQEVFPHVARCLRPTASRIRGFPTSHTASHRSGGGRIAPVPAMEERRAASTRRRNTRSGRRSTDPKPAPLEDLQIGERKTAPIRALVGRVEAIERMLQTQLQRIAQLQVALDRLTTPIRRRVADAKIRKSKRV
jgi:hypothetical protein